VNAAALPRRVPAARARQRPRAAARRLAQPPVVAFFALALLAGMRFAALLAHPPALGVLGVVAVASALGAALSSTRSLPRRHGLATAARLLILALGAYLALRAAGAPPRLLWPWRWGGLAHQLSRGLDALDGSWPYAGTLAQARLTVMFALASTIVTAAALAFWPTPRRAPARRALALVALLGLYVTAVANESQVGWQVQGVLLLALLCLWRWAWRPRALDGRAAAWLLACAALGLALAGAVYSRTPLIDYRHWNPFGSASPATSFDWNQTYGPLPWSTSTATMVSVAAPTPYLWRATTLDRFDGVGFVRSEEQPSNSGWLTGATLRARWITHATFTVRGLASAQLLSPGQIVSASIAGDAPLRLSAVAPDGTLSVSGAPPRSGDRYTITAYLPQPTAAEMRRAPRTYPAAYAPYTELELPAGASASSPVSTADAAGVARIEASPYARVYALARRLATGASGAYELAARIEAFLRRGFAYDLHPPRSADPLVSFLLDSRLGYCEQFSGAMTLLLRMDGVPARVAAGFLPGARDPSTGLYEVSARDAHAWVEVFFAGIGWVPFNPTPAGPLAGGSDPLLAAQPGAPATLRHRAAPLRARTGTRRQAASAASGSELGFAAVLAIGLGAALALGALWWMGAARAERALAGDADGAVRELSRTLARIGVEFPSAMTLAELERRLQRSHGPAASRYVRLLRERRYAPHPDPRLPCARDRRLMRRALCARRGPLTRLRVLLALAPGTRIARRREASAGAAQR
jgi:transglutaminase-like putative cysteine protease